MELIERIQESFARAYHVNDCHRVKIQKASHYIFVRPSVPLRVCPITQVFDLRTGRSYEKANLDFDKIVCSRERYFAHRDDDWVMYEFRPEEGEDDMLTRIQLAQELQWVSVLCSSEIRGEPVILIEINRRLGGSYALEVCFIERPGMPVETLATIEHFGGEYFLDAVKLEGGPLIIEIGIADGTKLLSLSLTDLSFDVLLENLNRYCFLYTIQDESNQCFYVFLEEDGSIFACRRYSPGLVEELDMRLHIPEIFGLHFICLDHLFYTNTANKDTLRALPIEPPFWTPKAHPRFRPEKRLAIREVLMAVDERLPVCLRDTLFEFMAKS